MRRTPVAYLALVVASFLFGATFVVIKEAITTLPPLSFVGWRFLIGSAVLLALVRPRTARLWRDGVGAGVLLFAGYALQTLGLARTTAANSGLITGLYVVFTPFVVAVVARRAVRYRVVAGATLSFAGLALLTVGEDFSLQSGDLLTMACALAFAGHIVVLARVAPRHAVVPLTAVQLLTTAALSLLLAAPIDGLPLPSGEVLGAVVFTGLAVSAFAFLLQVWSQTVVGPSRTAIILSLEPAFAAATAAVVLDERLTGPGWVGAGLILVGIYLVLFFTPKGDDVPAAEAVTPAH